jgi:type I restriction enzyme M protein
MTLTNGGSFSDKVNFIWSVADLLRGDYRPSEYGKVILPLVVLRRLDCVLADTKEAVLKRAAQLEGRVENPERALCAVAGQQFYNTSALDFGRLTADSSNIAAHLRTYIGGFSPGARDVIAKFRFDEHITRLDEADLLYLVLSKFAAIDLHPSVVDSTEMGYIYEELIRRFSEQSNETAGEHFTPREVIRLMVNLLFIEDDDLLRTPGRVATLFDPACGTGGMLAVAEEYLRELNESAALEVFGQELNDESYAICRSDMMLKAHDASNIRPGNSFSQDRFGGQTFDYMLANPPFGVEWKRVREAVDGEHKQLGFAGRFGAGLPRINDGSLLFLQHMISKMKPVDEGGSRIAIVFNGSPLFTGGAGSGESEIRRWIIENDWLEAVVALPEQLFYNTGISTYFWVVTNRKAPHRRGKVQLVDARDLFEKMGKSLGNKRRRISPEQIAEITRLYGDFTEGERVKILPNATFGFMRVTVERPLRLRWEISKETLTLLRDEPKLAKVRPDVADALIAALAEQVGLSTTDRKTATKAVDPILKAAGLITAHAKVVWSVLAVRDPEAPIITDRKGEPDPDLELRDQENVRLPDVPVEYETDLGTRLATVDYRTAVEHHLQEEVKPYVPDAWVDHSKTRIGYEIPLTRYFYRNIPPRPLEEIDAEIKTLEAEIQELLRQVTE